MRQMQTLMAPMKTITAVTCHGIWSESPLGHTGGVSPSGLQIVPKKQLSLITPATYYHL